MRSVRRSRHWRRLRCAAAGGAAIQAHNRLLIRASAAGVQAAKGHLGLHLGELQEGKGSRMQQWLKGRRGMLLLTRPSCSTARIPTDSTAQQFSATACSRNAGGPVLLLHSPA